MSAFDLDLSWVAAENLIAERARPEQVSGPYRDSRSKRRSPDWIVSVKTGCIVEHHRFAGDTEGEEQADAFARKARGHGQREVR